MAFSAGLPELTIYPQALCASLSSPHRTDWWKAVTPSVIVVKLRMFGLLSRNPMYRMEGRLFIIDEFLSAKMMVDTVLEQFRKVLVRFQVKIFKKNMSLSFMIPLFMWFWFLKILFGWKSKQFDNETAFLYGTLDEEIYMQFHDGYERYLQTEKGKDFFCKRSLCNVITIFI
jgi:hypothetical protein